MKRLVFILLALDLPSTFRRASEVVLLSWAFCENCLSLRVFRRWRVFSQHDNSTASMGTPCLLGGDVVVAAFFGYFFGL